MSASVRLRRMGEIAAEAGWGDVVRQGYLQLRSALGGSPDRKGAFYQRVLRGGTITTLDAAGRECADVAEWARQHDIPVRVVQAAGTFERHLPPDLTDAQNKYFLPRAHANSLPKYLCALHDARVAGENGLCILPDGSYATESVYGAEILARERSKFGRRTYTLRARRGVYFSLVDLWDQRGGINYYHWMHDAVSRLYKVLDVLPADTRFIVRQDIAPFAVESLELLGIPRHRLRYIQPDELWQVETLWFTPPSHHSGNDVPWVSDWFRTRYHQAVGASSALSKRRILISRRRAGSRRILNQQEFESFLQAQGFESLELESLSLREQIRLFAEAELVVGVQGAGLLNLWFVPPGGAVFEILEPSLIANSYISWTMADALGLEYYFTFAESVENPGNYPDVRVPMESFRQVFAKMMDRPKTKMHDGALTT